jgi:ribose/xylose/arabinose/galactoside ABC-type transport system permease subunit
MIMQRVSMGAAGPGLNLPIRVAVALRYGGVVAAILVLLGFANASVFFSGLNFQNIAYDAAIPGLPAIGLALAMSTGGIDLSVGAILSLCGAVTGWMIADGTGERPGYRRRTADRGAWRAPA